MDRITLEGQQFGDWTVTEKWVSDGHRTRWLCRCLCGTEKLIRSDSLRSGSTLGCGCRAKERMGDAKRTHGLTNSPTWTVWCAMIQRCKNPKTRGYASYGGRGIRVCRRWKKFENFLADMGERPEGYSLERRDVNGNYEPDNCIWIPMEDQHANKRNTVTITVDGVTKRLVEWAREKGVQPQMIEKRIYAGWPPDLAVMAPKGSTRASLRHRQSIDDAA